MVQSPMELQHQNQLRKKVFSLLNKLDKSKATGLDKISARFVRECADLICVPICDIFNQSISQGIFPDDWKYALEGLPLFINRVTAVMLTITAQYR